jgi:hypothetical protein
MKQFIIENAQWIFSGVGVAVIVGVVRLILNWRKKARNLTPGHASSQNITAGQGSTNIQTGSASTVLITANHPTAEARTHETRPITISTGGGVIYKARIFEGDFQEFIWGGTTVRISVFQITSFYYSLSHGRQEAMGVEIGFSTGGGLVWGGADCKNTGTNRYLMPQKEFQDEEPCSVYFYHIINEKYFRFMRVFVDHINQHSRQVTLSLFFVDIDNVKAS